MEIFSFRELSGGERRWRNFINLICEQKAEIKVGSIRFSTVTKKRIEYFPNMAEVTEQSVNEVVTRRISFVFNTVTRGEEGGFLFMILFRSKGCRIF
ncbi:MAG: hypothetical protein H6Q72_3240 [Firmicutes bacterium]|nr:hypothetical protein [Bacillota bacterium]